jgi:hypothetical protein
MPVFGLEKGMGYWARRKGDLRKRRRFFHSRCSKASSRGFFKVFERNSIHIIDLPAMGTQEVTETKRSRVMRHMMVSKALNLQRSIWFAIPG